MTFTISTGHFADYAHPVATERRQQRDAERDLMARRDLVERIVRQLVRRERWASLFEFDLIAHGVDMLERKRADGPLPNEEAYLRRAIRNRMLDYDRVMKTDARRLERLALVASRVKVSKTAGDGQFDVAEHGAPIGGLSLQFIATEEEAMLSLQASIAAACLPEVSDQQLLRDKFFDPSEPTLEELGRRHGGKSAPAMANYLRKFFGSDDQPGAVEPAVVLVGRMSLPIARAYIEVMQNFDHYDVLSNPFAAAIGHLEFAGRFSPAHRKYAAEGKARLQWLERHMPSNRGLPNKVLRRLILAGCFYVVKHDDAAHDQWHPQGLADDVRVLKRVFEVVRDYSAKS